MIYIGDDIVDLYPDTKISLNVKRIEIGDLTARYVTYTNNIRVPRTENNDILFGNPSEEATASALPYTIRNGKYIDGVTIIQDAIIYISKSRPTEYDISIYENVFDFFSEVKGLTVRDVEPIADSAWDGTVQAATDDTTDGLINARIWWGKSGVDHILPSFFYHTFVTKVLEYTGLTPSGNILTDSRFTDLVIPYFQDKFEYPEEFYSQFNRLNVLGSDVPATDQVNVEAVVVGFNFTEASHGTIQGFFSIGGITWGNATELTGRIKKNGSTVASVSIALDPAPGGTAFVEYTDFFDVGDVVNIVVYSDAMSSPGADYTRVNNCYIKYVADGLINPDEVYWNELFTDLSCEALLTDFFNRFGVIYKQVDNTLYLKTFEEILGDDDAIDWTDKLSERAEINFSLNYAQNNYFVYQDLIEDANAGRGALTINSNKLPIEKNIFVSTFGNSLSGFYDNDPTYRAFIPVYISTSADIYDFDQSPGLRLLTLKQYSGYKAAYFLDSTEDKDTGFNYFIGEFYTNLQEALQKNKLVTKFYYLTLDDIVNYDPFKLVYDNDGYYIINRIVNFVEGKLTKVELFKVR